MSAESGWPEQLRSQQAIADAQDFIRSLETRFHIYINTMRRLVEISGDEREVIGRLHAAVMKGFDAIKPEARDAIVEIIGEWVRLADRQTEIVSEATESMLAEDERSRKAKALARNAPSGGVQEESKE